MYKHGDVRVHTWLTSRVYLLPGPGSPTTEEKFLPVEADAPQQDEIPEEAKGQPLILIIPVEALTAICPWG